MSGDERRFCVLHSNSILTRRFARRSLSKVKISTVDIIRNYGSIVAVDIAILVVWMVTEGMEAVTVAKTDLAPYGSYTAITCNKAETYETLTTFFKILLVAGGVYLSYVTRNVPDKFAESKWIAMSIYQVFVLGVVGLLVKWSSPEGGTVLLVQSIAVPVACVATTCCIFGPKVLMIKYPQNYESALVTSVGTAANTSSGGSSSDSEKEDLMATIAAMEKEIEELKKA